MIHLDHRDSRPIYEQIADAFRRQIDGGILAPGDKLPSVRELSARLTINPNTIQRAYRELESEGFIFSSPGKGSFVATRELKLEDDQWNRFDQTVRALLERGVSREDMIDRIKQTGGVSDA
jgi:GntR family transcriptional regulator